MRKHLTLLFLLSFPGCGGIQTPVVPSVEKTSDDPMDVETKKVATDLGFRLQEQIDPDTYHLTLAIDPREEKVTGQVKIEARLPKAARSIRLNAKGIKILSARIRGTNTLLQGEWSLNERGHLVLSFPSALEARPVNIEIEFETQASDSETGLFRKRAGDHWYLFSRFDPIYARRSFPCFDEPSSRAQFKLELRVPQNMVAVSSAPEVGRKQIDGHLVFSFEKTQPIAPHMLAFAVGPFDISEPENQTGPVQPMRLISTRGKGALGQYALQRAALIDGYLKGYFKRGAPFPKLDLLAVPTFESGSTHTVGLMKLRESLMLMDGSHASIRRRLWLDTALAQQMAHTWAGNFVGPTWWSDNWFVESMATHVAQKTVQSLNPKLQGHIEAQRLSGIWKLMELDSHAHTQAVNVPIDDEQAVINSEDGAKFLKGATVLAMLESWIGVEAFDLGLRTYLSSKPFGHGTAHEWSEIIQEQTGLPIPSVLDSYMNQPGVPRVDMKLDCSTGVAVRLQLEQSRGLPFQSIASRAHVWQIPICVRYGDAHSSHAECFLMKSPKEVVSLSTSRCPTWLHGNADEAGYYQWTTSSKRLRQLLDEGLVHLSTVERRGIPQLLHVARDAQAFSFSEYLAAIEQLLTQVDPIMLNGLLKRMETLAQWIPAEQRENALSGWIRKHLRPVFNRLDEETAMGPEARRIRSVLAYLGDDPDLQRIAHELSQDFLSNPNQTFRLPPIEFLPLAARSGGPDLWTKLKATLNGSLTTIQRIAVISALGAFEDPRLFKKSLNLMNDGYLEPKDLGVLGRGIGHRTRGIAWQWLTQEYATLTMNMSSLDHRRLPWIAHGFCSDKDLERVVDFFESTEKSSAETAQHLDLVVQKIHRCITERTRIDTEEHQLSVPKNSQNPALP